MSLDPSMNDAKPMNLDEHEAVPNAGPTAESTGPSHDDHLPTTRLPPIAPPPRPRSAPPPGVTAVGASGPESADELTRVRPQSNAPPAIAPTWPWKALFSGLTWRTPRPVGPRAVWEEGAAQRAVGIGSAGVGAVVAIGALVVGLRNAPTEGPPLVAASIVLGHAIVAAALLAFSLGLFVLGERLYLAGRPPQ